jgi:hypothetical protein
MATSVIKGGLEIVNLNQFRADLKRAAGRTPSDLRMALKAAGVPLLDRVREYASAASRTGRLEGGYSIRATASWADILNREPYAAGAEWGMHGKWSGFTKYPAAGFGGSAGRGRFAWRATVDMREELVELVAEKLRDVMTAYGWAT